MKLFSLYILFLTVVSCTSQTILNAYAQISSIASGSILSVSNVNQTSHTFTVGGKVIIMQMQDDVIGSNTSNNSSFGDLSAIANAGKYEIKTISSCSPSSGTPTVITLNSALTATFNTGSNSSVQIISLRNLGANYTTTANITGLAWNGTVGGVVAIEVTNTLTLNHSITADAIGFLGGSRSGDADEACANSFYTGNDANKGYKGEGIYKRTSSSYLNGRAKILSGGGGGSQNNGGGGAGSNYSAGGNGGYGWQCNSGNSGQGIGGISLASYVSGNRVFMGGGGGGGQQNNTVGTSGANGGGIILIKASAIVTNTVCGSAIKISANGQTAANSGNDGSGGAGAGGSIVLDIATFSANSVCPLSINANGGNGGNVGNSGAHGGGGGGGQGVVVFSIAQPTLNITTTTTNGAAGTDDTGGTTSGTSGGGANNSGLIAAAVTPLPIELLYFNGEVSSSHSKLYWATASEINNDYFTIEKSLNGIDFITIGVIRAVGNSIKINTYELFDVNPFFGLNYYRLKQTDTDGKHSYSKIITILFEKEINFSVFPNPANDHEAIYVSLDKSKYNTEVELAIYDITGKGIMTRHFSSLSNTNSDIIHINDIPLAKGIYVIRFYNSNSNQTKKLVIY